MTEVKLPANPLDPSLGPLRWAIIPETNWTLGEYQEGQLETKRKAPSWSDLVDWELLGEMERNKGRDLRVSEKTAQFFRNLAYRMGRTIGHVKEIEDRLRRPAAGKKSGAERDGQDWWQPFSRHALHQAIDHWNNSIQYGTGEIELKPPRMDDVVQKVDTNHTIQDKVDIMQVGTQGIIREGIIDDCVNNRSTMYPGRRVVFEDSSGNYIDDNHYTPNKFVEGTTRPSLFKWATASQRRYQARHTRPAFFSMRRWPLRHQTEEQQNIIKNRLDEKIRANPSDPNQAYGILTPRIPITDVTYGMGQHGRHHGGQQQPPLTRPGTNKTSSDDQIKDTKVPEQTKTNNDTKGLDGTKVPENTKPPSGTHETSIPKPQVPHIQNTNNTPSPTPNPINNIPAMAAQANNNGGQSGQTQTQTQAQPPAPRPLMPYTRPTRRFMPGPAVFPMPESLLQEIVFNQTMERECKL